MADKIRERILAAPTGMELATPLDITGVEVVVVRQNEIYGKIQAATAKTSGTAITIMSEGFQSLHKDHRRPRLAQTYNICVWSRPIIAGNALLAESVMESIICRLWRWMPAGSYVFGEAEVRNGGLVPDTKFLRIDCEVVIPLAL